MLEGWGRMRREGENVWVWVWDKILTEGTLQEKIDTLLHMSLYMPRGTRCNGSDKTNMVVLSEF